MKDNRTYLAKLVKTNPGAIQVVFNQFGIEDPVGVESLFYAVIAFGEDFKKSLFNEIYLNSDGDVTTTGTGGNSYAGAQPVNNTQSWLQFSSSIADSIASSLPVFFGPQPYDPTDPVPQIPQAQGSSNMGTYLAIGGGFFMVLIIIVVLLKK